MAKKGTFPANAMRRGEIYWVDIPNAIGHELMKDRPAIIVSCDALNDNSPVVQVVYCSASPKKELPEHITIRSTEQISTALCENVYTVDKSRVGRYVGRCTKREMEQVDLGLLSGLGLAQYGLASPQEDEEEPEPVRGDTEDGTASMALVIAQTERDTYDAPGGLRPQTRGRRRRSQSDLLPLWAAALRGHLHDRKAQQKQSISIPERPWAYGLGSLIFFVRPRKWSPPLQGERERKGGMGGW